MPTVLAVNNNLTNQWNTKSTNSKIKSPNSSRRGSKPIIDWFQRKLGATVRTRRVSSGDNKEAAAYHSQTFAGSPTRVNVDQLGFRVSSPSTQRAFSGEISLNDNTDASTSLGNNSSTDLYHDDATSTRMSAAVSVWSRSNPPEADEDASVRPLPPTSPPSPSPSRSSSSYLSDPRTFKSISASTKPTTIMSLDLTATNGAMAHIAQAPPTPTITNGMTTARFPPHIRTSSSLTNGPGTSITFSALPPSPQGSSRPSSTNPVPARPGSLTGTQGIQAPQHSMPHPRNNPRPSSPPLDNASMLTLASSAFGMPAWVGGRTTGYTWAAGGDSVSHLGAGDSISHFVVDEYLNNGEDRDASVRALRPRSSRRGSWDSEASGWSAKVSGVPGGPGSMSLGVTGIRGPSIRTGGFEGSVLEPDIDDQDERSFVEDIDEEDDAATPGMAKRELHSSESELHTTSQTPTKEEAPFEQQQEKEKEKD